MKNVFCFVLFLVSLCSCSYGQNFNESALKVSMAMNVIQNWYVDTVNTHKLAEDAIVAMLQKLDPHSAYMTPEEVKEMNEPLQGNFDGIGIQFNMLTDTLYVIQVIPGGPSEKVGIMAGDRIIYVNDTLISGVKKSTSDIMSRLRGPKGTVVNVKVLRGNNSNLISFKIVRGKIPIYSLDASYMIDKETGYIKLNRFAETTFDEFKTALKELQQKGLQNLILDLQGNGGGYMHRANEIANEFLQQGSLIVYTEGVHQHREETHASKKGSFEQGKVVVLIDESSASASEIVTGALQDWDRAVVVGRRSFGKGLVQRTQLLPDGSMIKLTTSRYYTPTGRSIQKPYEKGNLESYNTEVIQRYNRGEMLSADSIHFPDSLKYNTLVNKRIVYGGGGIMPDYFVPLDTSLYTDIHRSLVASGVVNKLVMNHIDKNRSSLLKQYQNHFDTYKSNFRVTESMLNSLLDLFKKENFELISFNAAASDQSKEKRTSAQLNSEDMAQFDKSKSLLQLQIKALIARDLWNMNEYFQIINEENNALQKGIEIIENSKEYNKLLGK